MLSLPVPIAGMFSPQKELTSVRYLVTHPAPWFNSLISGRISHMPLLILHLVHLKAVKAICVLAFDPQDLETS